MGICIGFALGAASFALASPQKQTVSPQIQTRPYCPGLKTLDEYRACSTIRNWCAWVAAFSKPMSRPEDPQVVRLLDQMRRSCPPAWRS